ncbi:MAG: hypothetical protein ACREIS_02725, partial [Nitrospiraceae bacterium]
MDRFIMQHRDRIVGSLSCFDRVIFKGHLSISYPTGLEKFLGWMGLKLKDFKELALNAAGWLKCHAQLTAERAGRPYQYLNRPVRKEDLARQIAERDGVRQGLICVFGTLEPVQAFRVVYGEDRPRLRSDWRKCLVHYFYLRDRQFGVMHVRRSTWFPFTMQVYVNGHEWLARRLEQLRLTFCKLDNAFLTIARPQRAQRLAREFARLPWPEILGRFAQRFNPLLRDVLHPLHYYWVTDQAEYSTDVMFRSRADLQALYPALLRHATLGFQADDVMRFLGRKLHPAFQGEIVSDLKHRVEGARIKHRAKRNWIKMYDKHGRVLRVETVINQPREFKVRRVTVCRKRRITRWTPMPKGVAFLDRIERIGGAANQRYLDALANVEDPSAARRALDRMAQPAGARPRRHRGFNPADPDDARLFAAVLRGEHLIAGFRNRQVREALFGATADRTLARRQAAHVTRLFGRLHAHGYIAKVPHTRRWRVTLLG